jgi:hypothetical protein
MILLYHGFWLIVLTLLIKVYICFSFFYLCNSHLFKAHSHDNVYRQEPVKIKQPADLENALKQPLTPAFAVSLLKRFLKELPEQLIPPEQSSGIFKIINDPGNKRKSNFRYDYKIKLNFRSRFQSIC